MAFCFDDSNLTDLLACLEIPVMILTPGGDGVELLTPAAGELLRSSSPTPPLWLRERLSPLLAGEAADRRFFQCLETGGGERLFHITLRRLGNDRILVHFRDAAGPGFGPKSLVQLIQGVSTATGETFFRSMAQHLVRAFGADHAFIGEFADGERKTVRTVALCIDGEIVDNCQFPLAGTPCERVVTEGLQCFSDDVPVRFPEEIRAAQLGVVAYYGIPLHDGEGRVIGLMSVMGRRPLPNGEIIASILQVFADRAASELEHQMVTAAKQAQLHFLQSLLDAIPNPVFFKDPHGCYLGCNAALTRTLGLEKEQLVGRQVFDVAPEPRASLCHREDQAVFATGETRSYETPLTFADGRRREVVFYKAPFYRQSGEIGGLVGVIHDLTERKEMEERYRILFDQSPDAILILDPQTSFPLQFNARMPGLLGYTSQEFALLPLSDPRVNPDPLRWWEKLALLLANDEQQEFECRLVDKEGHAVEVLIHARPVELAGRRVLHMILRDITQKKRAEEALRRSRELADTVLKTMNDAAAIIDTAEFRVIWANQVFLEEYRLTAEQAGGLHCHEITRCSSAPGTPGSRNCPLRRTLDTGDYALTEHVLPTDSGEEKFVEVATSPVRDNTGRIVQAVYISRNVTERKRAERQIYQLAYFDSLTGLPNRTLLRDRLHQEIFRARRDGRKVALLFLDLDRFKRVNDSMGHGIGDELLKMVGRRLSATLRKSDTIARLGGDEFIIVLPQLRTPREASRIAGKVLAALRLPFPLAETEVFSSASIGIACYPEDGPDLDTLLKNADMAMYQAKEGGRNRFQFFSREMNQQAIDRLAMESRLRRALPRREFLLHYQPQIDVASGRITGLEALIRWRQPELGLISPAQFIPLAEESGLIIPIGEWVLEEACAQNRRWQEAGLPPVTVAVNLSGRQFKHEKLVDSIQKILRRTGLPPQWLELELTESILMDNAEAAREKLDQLKQMGVKLAVDDFGTGYSSLNYLKHFPLDRLKIDQSFVRDLTDDPDDARIVEAIIALAHGLRLAVVAEGVETADQLEFLQQRRCREMQGYFFSRPKPAEEIPALFLREASARTATG